MEQAKIFTRAFKSREAFKELVRTDAADSPSTRMEASVFQVAIMRVPVANNDIQNDEPGHGTTFPYSGRD
ncbi:hypothetical protein LTR10_017366 [Elasticomyces elasticus]|uniref:Uncharacterized protein n=1 Tax=Exophiala sideris TaxID=1016849 RepID=A0ABR0JAW4_9EURO|nr:hypothetical protein LTR10_017366 [Elasticomyces elasticus]KAK5037533.1 hypothetical protein LTR13_004690 [Exophiala sideris]KAK5059194.1 hypothetical protein LTR69_006483 [Exophiala sideris]KAK5183029.1 hypothetical protein LTR44_004739 [Eurotiomycetes sp. CCFEE 6388]